MAFRTFNTPESSNIVRVAYCPKRQELHVEFKGGAVYSYAEVPLGVAGEFYIAESVGSFFAKAIKPNYKCARIATPCGVAPDAEEVTA